MQASLSHRNPHFHPTGQGRLRNFVLIVFLLLQAASPAQSPIDSLKKTLQAAMPDTQRVMVMLNLGFQYELVNTDSALSVYARALSLASKCHDSSGMAKAELNIGRLAAKEGKQETAMYHYRRAISFFDEVKNDKGKATALHSLVTASLELADYKNAEHYILEAMRYYEATGNDFVLISLYGDLGQCYRSMLQPVKMMESFGSAHTLAKKLNDEPEMARTSLALGNAHLEMGRKDSAKFYFEELVQLGKSLRDAGVEFSGKYQLLLLDIAQRKLPKTQVKLLPARIDSLVVLAEKTGDAGNEIRAQLLRGSYLLQNKKFIPALAEFQSALDRANQEKNTVLQMESLEAMARYYESRKKKKEALPYRVMLGTLRDSALTAGKTDRLEELRSLAAQLDDQRIESVVALESVREKNEAKQDEWMRYGIIIGSFLVLMVLLFFVLYLLSLRRLKKTRMSAETSEEEKVEVASPEEPIAEVAPVPSPPDEMVPVPAAPIVREEGKAMAGDEKYIALLSDARKQMEQLSRESGAGIPIDKFLAFQNIITRTISEIRKAAKGTPE